jgi:hypothetical protein
MATKTTDRVALQRRLTTTDATASAPPQFPWLKTSSLRTICFIRTKFSNSCFLFFRNFYVILFHFVDVSYESLTTRCSLQHIIQLVDFLHYQHLARSKTLPFSTQSRPHARTIVPYKITMFELKLMDAFILIAFILLERGFQFITHKNECIVQSFIDLFRIIIITLIMFSARMLSQIIVR